MNATTTDRLCQGRPQAAGNHRDGPLLRTNYPGQRRSPRLSRPSEAQDLSVPTQQPTNPTNTPKPVLLTGSGRRELATATAEALAQGKPATLILLGTSHPETQPAIDDINEKFPKVKIVFVTVDLGSLASVREAAGAVRRLDVKIDGIVGYPTVIAAKWAVTNDGIEAHFQRNYLSHFLLVNLLRDRMAKGSSIVMISSSIRPAAPAPGFEDPNFLVS